MTMAQNTENTAGTNVTAFGLSYAITSILSAILVVMKEASVGIHDGLAAITGHHWVTHGILDIILFVVLGIVLSRTNAAQMSAKSLISTVVGATVVSGLIIAGYFM